MHPVISSNELKNILVNIGQNKSEAETSLNLGQSKSIVKLAKNGFYYEKNVIIIPKIKSDDKNCYVILDGKLEKLQFFAEDTNSLYKLIPTSFRPILQISGTSMHKKEFVDRVENDKLTGKILDSGTGLGYTAIIAARTAVEVITIEKDKNVTEMAKFNPYSQELFKAKNIKRISGNIVQKITKFADSEFDYIIFDAGTPRSSDDFFSLKNYQQAFRVLKSGGKLYHYVPKHQIQRGRDFGGEVIARMQKAGFSQIERQEQDSYLVAGKD